MKLFFRSVLAVVAVALTLCAPAMVTAQISSPTGVTLPRGLPILVQWSPSFFTVHGPVANISYRLFENHSFPFTGMGPMVASLWVAGVLPNNGQAYVNLQPQFVCNPVYHYQIQLSGAPFGSTQVYVEDSAFFKLSCEGGSIKVVKTVVNGSGSPLSGGVFPVDVACGPNGPNTTLSLSNANNFQDSVTYIPLGSQCTINEPAPSAPLGCRWHTTYPKGKSVTVGNAVYQREVRNQLTCLGNVHLATAAVNHTPGIHFQADPDTAPAACCSPDWNSVPQSSYNNPIIIAACSAPTQGQCVSNAAIHCLWNSQAPGCSNTAPVACCSPDWNSVPSSSYNNPMVIAACSAGTQAQCVSNAAIHCLWNSQAAGCSGAEPVACCTRQLSNNGVNCGGSSSNPPNPSAEANCLALGNHAVQKGCNWNPKCGGVETTGCCLKRDAATGTFANCAGFPAGGTTAQCKVPCQWNPLNAPGCGGSKPAGSLTVTKAVTSELKGGDTAPNTSFLITVTCSNGLSQAMHLSGGASQTIPGLPAGTTCAVSETINQSAFMSFPRSCVTTNAATDPGNIFSSVQGPAVWAPPVYTPAAVAIAPGANAVTVTNHLHCAFGIVGGKGPGPGSSADLGAAAKKTLQELADAYSAKRRTAFMRLVSEDFSGDLSTFEDALVKDFRNYSSVNLSLIPDSVEVNGLSVSVAFHYNLAVISYQGVSNKFSGSSSYVFRSEEGKVKLYKMERPIIFGNSLPSSENPMATAQNSLTAAASTAPGEQATVSGSAEITAAVPGGAGGPGTPGSGFRFGTQSNVPESSADIYLLGGAIKANAGSAIVSIGACSLNSVTSAPGTITGTSAAANRGECYAVRTAANKYAVLRVTSTGGALGGGSVGFDYKFQPGGSNSL